MGQSPSATWPLRSGRWSRRRPLLPGELCEPVLHDDVETTMIYTHVMRQGFSIRSPVDAL